MKALVKNALCSRPVPIKQETDLEIQQRIGQEVCSNIPALVDANNHRMWTYIMSTSSDNEAKVATQLADIFVEYNIAIIFCNKTLHVSSDDLRKVSLAMRKESDEEFLRITQNTVMKSSL